MFGVLGMFLVSSHTSKNQVFGRVDEVLPLTKPRVLFGLTGHKPTKHIWSTDIDSEGVMERLQGVQVPRAQDADSSSPPGF